MTAACRCGAVRDARGLCSHCDAPPDVIGRRGVGPFRVEVRDCPTACVPCRTRDSYCPVCRTYCGAPAAAEYHAAACRAAENNRRAA